MQIQEMLPADWQAVKMIYEQGIATGNATFQTKAPSWESWDAAHLKHSRLVAREAGKVLGWTALSGVSDRCVYAGVAEVSVYVATEARGKGLGKQLLEALVLESEKNGIWTLQAGLFPENLAGLKLHETCGFRLIGRREKIGKMNGLWRDTLLLEKRSQSIAAD